LDGGLPVVVGFVYRAATEGRRGRETTAPVGDTPAAPVGDTPAVSDRKDDDDWDIGVDAGGEYNPPRDNLGGYWRKTQRKEVGGRRDNNGIDVDFTLTYTVGDGYRMSLDETRSKRMSQALGRGDDDDADVSFLVRNDVQNGVRATDYYNAIMIAVRSDAEKDRDASASIFNLEFKFLDNGGETPCGGPLIALSKRGDQEDIEREWIISDSDLSETSWQLTGTMLVKRDSKKTRENDVQVVIYTVPSVPKAFSTCNNCAACPVPK
jgi:hypothetical protein